MFKPVFFSLLLSFFILPTASTTIARTDVFASALSNDVLDGQSTPSKRKLEAAEPSAASVPFEAFQSPLELTPQQYISLGTGLLRRVDKRMGLPWFGIWILRISVEDIFLNFFFGEPT